MALNFETSGKFIVIFVYLFFSFSQQKKSTSLLLFSQ